VVQHLAVDGRFATSPSQVSISYYLAGASSYIGGIPNAPIFSANIGIQFDAPTQFYVDQGNTLVVLESLGSPGVFYTPYPATVTVIGYLLDCLAAPCSAIAH
jgi:hypothetical protein